MHEYEARLWWHSGGLGGRRGRGRDELLLLLFKKKIFFLFLSKMTCYSKSSSYREHLEQIRCKDGNIYV